MKLLLHTCCAPCLLGTMPFLEGHDVSYFWFNPNIHPYTEYKARLDALKDFEGLIIKDFYGLREFISGVDGHEGRCAFCYERRLGECASFAVENNFDAFSTTLLVSPYQKHEQIREIGEKCADMHGVKFFYRDFRPNFRNGQREARGRNIYAQKYCGCIFSEEERYLQF